MPASNLLLFFVSRVVSTSMNFQKDDVTPRSDVMPDPKSGILERKETHNLRLDVVELDSSEGWVTVYRFPDDYCSSRLKLFNL